MLILALGCHLHVPPEADPAGCAGCHAAEEASWRASPHAEAHDGPLFAVSWAEERAAWCLDCHPVGGVSCDGCHGGAARTCVDCHAFELPSALGPGGSFAAGSGVLAQTTALEWAQSSFADVPCASCHDPHAPGDPRARLRAAVDVALVRDGDTVRGSITTTGVGHGLPTGDPFRRLELAVCADLACDRRLASAWLQRRLTRLPDGGWAHGSDVRVPPPMDGDVASLPITLHAPGARSWRLTAHLADPRHESQLGDAARFVVATGLVEVE